MGVTAETTRLPCAPGGLRPVVQQLLRLETFLCSVTLGTSDIRVVVVPVSCDCVHGTGRRLKTTPTYMMVARHVLYYYLVGAAHVLKKTLLFTSIM